MPQRLALITASVVATVVLTVGLVAGGFAPVPQPGQPVDAASADTAVTAEQAIDPGSKPEVVYVKPAPSPKTIVLEKQTASKKQAATRKVASSGSRVTRTTRAEFRDDDDHEGRQKASEHAREREDD